MSERDDAVELSDRRCAPCEGGVEPLSRAHAEALLARLHRDWTLDDEAKGIVRSFRFRDFYRTMSFVNAIAHVANTEDHHPDLEVGYDRCRVRYRTHSIRGLSVNDFICAAKIDRL
ncbi:MAG: 4a-hydroxytetrahydrobiopterin dehydratase [Gammaproteobacteria bacterium]|nr:4a-hydroxytetrahydrobiopterin dehydratase [Gammaproteobacteria bacterium]